MLPASQNLYFIEELKRQWLAMIDTIQDPLVLIDRTYNIIRHNKSYFEKSQKRGFKTLREMKDSKCFEVFANRSQPCEHCRAFLAISDDDSEWSTKDLLTDRTIEIRSHTLRPNLADEHSANDDLYVVHYRDMTDQIALQESLAQADKMAALGKLTGGVAHEINSPLAGILAFAQVLLMELPSNDPHREDVIQIEDAAKKCKAIVENMLGFARQDKTTEKSKFSVASAIKQTLQLANPILKKHRVKVSFDPQETDGEFQIFGHPGKIGQVFMNLITNAAYAMKEGGGLISLQLAYSESNVLVQVADCGCGIAEAALSKIFDPFFTTKPVGEGTGLGLSISYAIIKQHGGEIKVESVLGEGTTFTIVIPKDHLGQRLSQPLET